MEAINKESALRNPVFTGCDFSGDYINRIDCTDCLYSD